MIEFFDTLAGPRIYFSDIRSIRWGDLGMFVKTIDGDTITVRRREAMAFKQAYRNYALSAVMRLGA